MRKSTALKIVVAIALATALLIAARAVVAARSYVECSAQILSSAPPSDSSPPATYRRLSLAFWHNRDLFLARMLAQECGAEARGDGRNLRRQVFALGVVKTRLSLSQREALGAVLMPSPGGRGLTQAAQTEWGRSPASLSEAEMTWIFVVGRSPSCSKLRATPEQDRQGCASLYQSLLAEIPRLQTSAPQT